MKKKAAVKTAEPRRHQKRRPPPAMKSLEPRALLALWIKSRVDAGTKVTVPVNTADALRNALIADVKAVLSVPAAGVDDARLVELIARVDGTSTHASPAATYAPIRAARLLRPFLVGLDVVPERAGVGSTAHAIQRLRHIAGDHAIPYEARAAIAHDLAALCPWVVVQVPKYSTEDLGLAFYRFFSVHKTLEQLANVSAGDDADWVAIAAAALDHADELSRDGDPLARTIRVPRVVIAVEEMLRAVFDDALTDAGFAHVALAWINRRRESGDRAMADVATAHEVIAAAFGEDVESVKAAVRELDEARVRRPVVDAYGTALHQRPRAHPAFWFWMIKDWAVFTYIRRWLWFPHAPWTTKLHRMSTTASASRSRPTGQRIRR